MISNLIIWIVIIIFWLSYTTYYKQLKSACTRQISQFYEKNRPDNGFTSERSEIANH